MCVKVDVWNQDCMDYVYPFKLMFIRTEGLGSVGDCEQPDSVGTWTAISMHGQKKKKKKACMVTWLSLLALKLGQSNEFTVVLYKGTRPSCLSMVAIALCQVTNSGQDF